MNEEHEESFIFEMKNEEDFSHQMRIYFLHM